jgi:hypothetical protein
MRRWLKSAAPLERSRRSAKQRQAKPSSAKSNRLDLLGFIRPNRDFSMGCGGKKQKNPGSFPLAARRPEGAGPIRHARNHIARDSGFRKQIPGFLIRPDTPRAFGDFAACRAAIA